jgi:hypothetical protein
METAGPDTDVACSVSVGFHLEDTSEDNQQQQQPSECAVGMPLPRQSEGDEKCCKNEA